MASIGYSVLCISSTLFKSMLQEEMKLVERGEQNNGPFTANWVCFSFSQTVIIYCSTYTAYPPLRTLQSQVMMKDLKKKKKTP